MIVNLNPDDRESIRIDLALAIQRLGSILFHASADTWSEGAVRNAHDAAVEAVGRMTRIERALGTALIVHPATPTEPPALEPETVQS